MSNAKLFLHLWFKKSNYGNDEAKGTYYIYRSGVTFSPNRGPREWDGKTISDIDVFDVQEIKWPIDGDISEIAL